MKLVMFAWGNPSRGDDGLGPWFAERFRHCEGADFELVEDFQLQVEHLLDCREAGLLLFVDARCDGGVLLCLGLASIGIGIGGFIIASII